MKTKNLIIILLFAVQVAKGQYLDPNSKWIYITTNRFDSTYYAITTHKLDGDTLINDTSYFKYLIKDNFFCGVRETEKNKIYAYFPDIQKELLIYDFDWEEGKEIKFQRYEEPDVYYPFIINQIDSVKLLDNNYYKCLKSGSGINDIFCIQGIGSLSGFLSHLFYSVPNGDISAILCFYKGEQLIYCNPEYNSCSLNTSESTVKKEPEFVEVYNPGENRIIVKPLTGNPGIIQIFDIAGNQIIQEEIESEESQICIPTTGTFIYRFISKTGEVQNGKVVVW